MKIHDCIQGTSEWLTLRAGIPTASEFDCILTPTGKPSASVERLLFSLLAERIMQRPRVEAVSMWMQRGSELEADAVAFYELTREAETIPVGFITNDEGTWGASPDRLVGDDGLLEIKCPKEYVHVSYLLKKSVDQAYYPQVQGQLWITGRKWLDILSYHPEMPQALVRVERDEEYIALLGEAVRRFSVILENYSRELQDRGWIKAWPIPLAIQESSSPATASPTGQSVGGEGAARLSAPFITEEDEKYVQSLTSQAPTPSPSPTPTPSPAPREDNAYRTFLILMAWLKHYDTSPGNAEYYQVLHAYGVNHANDIRDLRTGRKIVNLLVPVCLDETDPPFAELATKAANGERPPVSTPPPSDDPWLAEMKEFWRKAPGAFVATIAAAGIQTSIEEIPLNWRQGILESVRRACR